MARQNTTAYLELAEIRRPNSDTHQKSSLLGMRDHNQKTRWPNLQIWHKYHLSGWRSGVALSALSAFVVMIVNIIFLVIAVSNFQPLAEHGIGTLFHGNCSKVKTLGTWLRLLINILGTALLGASNYTQQCLVAPTRREIDKAHGKGDWLDIGNPSLRNLKLGRIAKRRVLLWMLLGLSSVPLHLVYNSVVFTNMSTYYYTVYPATLAILTAPQNNGENGIYSHLTRKLQNFERLDPITCINAYETDFITNHGDLILVLDPAINATFPPLPSSNPIEPILRTNPYKWMCQSLGMPCDLAADKENALRGNWTIGMTAMLDDEFFRPRVEYCLSEMMPERCRLQFSIPLLVVVIVFNSVKVLCLTMALWWQKEPTLVTVGDAVASFLANSDPTSKDCCLLSKDRVIKRETERRKHMKQKKKKIENQEDIFGGETYAWGSTPSRWYNSASKKRWFTTIFLGISSLAVAAGLLSIGLVHLSTNEGSGGWSENPELPSLTFLWNMGFGTVSANSLINLGHNNITHDNSLMEMILIANLPQVLLSFLYLAYNGLWTCMLLGVEWNEYAFKRKGLTVTRPEGRQRGTYWLSLPQKFAIPLLIMSGLLHWLVSQSIFLARLSVVGFPGDDGLTTCGYSSIALIFTIIVGSVTFLAVLVAGFWGRLKPGIPLGGDCSAVISAACHLKREENTDIWLEEVQWGAVEGSEHCGFGAQDVRFPITGKVYA